MVDASARRSAASSSVSQKIRGCGEFTLVDQPVSLALGAHAQETRAVARRLLAAQLLHGRVDLVKQHLCEPKCVIGAEVVSLVVARAHNWWHWCGVAVRRRRGARVCSLCAPTIQE
jgi:hypothetical protein